MVNSTAVVLAKYARDFGEQQKCPTTETGLYTSYESFVFYAIWHTYAALSACMPCASSPRDLCKRAQQAARPPLYLLSPRRVAYGCATPLSPRVLLVCSADHVASQRLWSCAPIPPGVRAGFKRLRPLYQYNKDGHPVQSASYELEEDPFDPNVEQQLRQWQPGIVCLLARSWPASLGHITRCDLPAHGTRRRRRHHRCDRWSRSPPPLSPMVAARLACPANARPLASTLPNL